MLNIVQMVQIGIHSATAHKKVLILNEFTKNEEEFTSQPTPAVFTTGTPKWRNSKERFRPAYRNEYRGWMVVGDASYIIPQINMRLSAGAGAASGDQNPHKDEKIKPTKDLSVCMNYILDLSNT